MNTRTKLGLVGAGAAFTTLAILGLASAQTPPGGPPDERPPRGPYVDFCPTPEQVESHLAEYGFDYKPTVACTSEGKAVSVAGSRADASGAQSAQESDQAAPAREKAFLKSLRRGRDTDGDPATMEAVGPDGEEVVILIQTGRPQLFEGMTPAEFAEKVYP
jgi:hypothetical protein